MKLQKRYLQIGALALGCAVLLRFGTGDAFARALADPRTAAVLLYLQTGYLVRPAVPEKVPVQTVATEETIPTETEQAPVTFVPQDADLVQVNSVCGYETDLPAWLQQPLQWDLQEEAPKVLILHTHATESYEKTEDYTESSSYRTLNTDYNVVSVGQELAQALEAGGVRVVHDKTIHDHPSYNSSYTNARKTIKEALEENPTVSMVLDVHRDAVEQNGEQIPLVTEHNGESVAQLMLVVGTDAGGLRHPDWPENMSLAVKLHARLEKLCPGICRPISFRKQRFNQDLSPGALIVEVGSAGNTRQEALAAARLLAQAVLELSKGTV